MLKLKKVPLDTLMGRLCSVRDCDSVSEYVLRFLFRNGVFGPTPAFPHLTVTAELSLKKNN